MNTKVEVFSSEPIVVDRVRLRVDSYRCAASERDTLQYAISAYGFLLQRKLVGAASKRFAFGAFASAIAEVYDLQCKRTAEIVRVLLALDRIQTLIAGLPVAEACAA